MQESPAAPAAGLGADFAGRPGTALVVGGNGGIGARVAAFLVARGSRVVVTHRRTPGEGRSLPLDLGAADAAGQADAVVEAVLAEHGALHTLVHAAGPHVPMVHLARVSAADMATQLHDDAGGFFTVVRAALPALRESRGSVVAVTTAATTRFPKRDGLSSAPKAAVEAMVRALAVEEGRYGVRVNAVGPGMLTDGMAARLIGSGELSDDALEVTRRNIPLGRFGTAEDIAEAVCFLASDRAGFVSGQKLDVDGAYGC